MLRLLVLSTILLTSLALSCLANSFSVRKRALATTTRSASHEYPFRPPISSLGAAAARDGEEEVLKLMDIVLLASVDGKFHALNRTSGHILWSMSSSAFPGSVPPILGPLVSTHHVESDADTTDDNAPHQELYIIEPQTGYIYVMSSPSSPLQRLAFSMSELVNMSPFSFSGEDDRRVFVGRKETSLFSLELETGKVKEVNSECPWDPFEDLHADKYEVDLDELESPDPPRPVTEIFIGRTDYHITIHTRPTNPSSPKPPIQNLSFSTYGPNNRDNTVQSTYHRSADDAYVQSFPNGDIFAFKTVDNPVPIDTLWINKFSKPVIAVFDIVQSTNREDPFVLTQPRPIFQDGLPNLASAYVGLIEETGSLFAMSPQHYPLVAFTESNDYTPGLPADKNKDKDVDLDGGLRKKETCRNGAKDRKCLTGKKQLEDPNRPWRNPLDGVPHVPSLPEIGVDYSSGTVDLPTSPSSSSGSGRFKQLPDNASTMPPSWRWISNGRAPPPLSTLLLLLGLEQHGSGGAVLFSLLVTAVALCVVWMYRKVWGHVPPGVRSDARHKGEDKEDSVRSLGALGDSLGPAQITQGDVKIDRDFALEKSEVIHLMPKAMTPVQRPSPSFPVSVLQAAPSISDEYVFLERDKDSNDKANVPKPVPPAEDPIEGDDSDREGDRATPGKRRGPKKKRRGKKKKAVSATIGSPEDEEGEKGDESRVEELKFDADTSPVNLVISSTPQMADSATTRPSLVVSDTILGFGSHGTVVFSGSLQGRAVAVKRLLQDFVTLASREVSILQESDDHPNVIRYYCQEAHANFLYIALELCPASLADIIENPDQFRDISISFDPKRALRQITSGLRHLHSLKIVHRDIKPQNILVSAAKKNGGKDKGHRMLISDFGLCKKLDLDQTSFLPTAQGAMAAGTVGWRAPEILRGEVKLDESAGDESQSSRGSVGTSTNGTTSCKPTRLTKLVDIFALGCLFYYTLTNGGHPFGDRFEREVNILKNVKSLEGLERFGEEGSEAVELISSMLSVEASDRPDTTTCLLHPFFWDQGRRLGFLQDASDRFEIMCRDPRDPNLNTLEQGAFNIVGLDWHSRLDKIFIDNLGKFRKYDGKSVQDLLRALRNKKHHYQDLPDNVKRHLGPMPEGFLSYFTRRFPLLFLHVHSVVASTSLRHESMFRSYFELTE